MKTNPRAYSKLNFLSGSGQIAKSISKQTGRINDVEETDAVIAPREVAHFAHKYSYIKQLRTEYIIVNPNSCLFGN
jgi:hypothetical protein